MEAMPIEVQQYMINQKAENGREQIRWVLGALHGLAQGAMAEGIDREKLREALVTFTMFL